MSDKPKKIPTGVFQRSTKLLSTGARVVTREVTQRLASRFGGDASTPTVLKRQLEQARDLVATLSQLKGAAMKAGQMLSIEYSDLLPPEVVSVLRELHSDATSMSFAEVEAILIKEWGRERFAELEDISREPIAAASIGQVHRARLGGSDVAIKVQFPGVADTIDSDLLVLKKMAGALLHLYGKDVDLTEVFDEIATSLKAEVDYRKEAQAAMRYRTAFAGDERFVVPEIFAEHSTEHVLTLAYMDGVRLGDWLATAPEIDERQHFAELVLDLLALEFFRAGLVQTDPNYGNFLYRPGERRLVVLDFGATKAYSKTFRREYLKLVKDVTDGDDDRMLATAEKLTLIDPREEPFVKRQFVDLLYLIMSMFLPDNQPFRFGDANHLNELRKAVIDFAKIVRYSAPPKNLILLNRKLGGMYHLLREADVAIDLSAILAQVEREPIE